MVKYLPAVGALLLAVVFAIGATRKPVTFACDRTTCTYGDRSFPFTAVREVRFVDGFGKNKTQAESQVIFANGGQISLGRADTDDARTTFEILRHFFAAGGPPTLSMTSRPTTWMWLLAVAGVIAAGVLAVRAKRKREVYRAPEQTRADWQKRRKYLALGAGAVVVIAGAQLLLMFVASRVQGTLVLECKQRCKFQGLECLPGGSSRQTLDEGTYPIEVWASSGSALWIPKTFTITTGETTTFVCQ